MSKKQTAEKEVNLQGNSRRGFLTKLWFALGFVALARGRYEEARVHFGRVLAMSRKIGDRLAEEGATGHLGYVCAAQGRYGEAGEVQRRP